MKKLTIGLTAVVLVMVGLARAETRHVPSEYATIQGAIDDCNNGDVVIVEPNTYTGAGNRDIDFKGLAITVRSTDPNDPCVVAATIVDCNGSSTNKHRGFKFINNEGRDSVLFGLTITNGYAPHEGGEVINLYGGAILCYSSDPTISKCLIKSNNGDGKGGGIHCEGGDPIISACTFSNNVASEGGGLYNHDANCSLVECNFISNQANYEGGGIYNYNSSGSVVNCSFEENSASNVGGGICNRGGSKPCIENSVFVANVGSAIFNATYSDANIISCAFLNNSSDMGGAISNIWCVRVTIDSSYFCGNSAGWGGAICEDNNSTSHITNCTFVGNFANDERGGAIYSYDSSPTLKNCTFYGNSSGSHGGVLYAKDGFDFGSHPNVLNCILWENIPEEIFIHSGELTVTYSDVLGGWEGEGNINADPCFADADANNFYLKSQAGRWDPNKQTWVIDANTSPCIDAGDMASPIGYEPFPNGGIINMGAYGGTAEASKSYFGGPVCETIVAGDINGDCKVDFKDFAIMAGHWLEGTEP